MIHPEIKLQFINDQIGYGIFASKFIPRGTVVWTNCKMDRLYTLKEIENLPSQYWEVVHKYAYVNAEGYFVLCWDNGRYENHSCEPNTLMLNQHCDIAIRDIHPGEEITCDYGSLNLYYDLKCFCKSAQCREIISGKDLLNQMEKWDCLVEQAIQEASKVSQPLLPYFLNKQYFQDQIKGREKFNQRMHYYSFKEEEINILKSMKRMALH